MSDRISEANEYLKSKLEDIKILYSGLKKISNVFFQTKEQKRMILHLYFSDKRKCISYSKLLLELKLGRLLVEDETCDHIDNDCTNDSLDNLQVLSRSENARKGPTEEVKRKIASINSKRMTGVEQPFNQGENNKCSKLSNAQVLEIKELQKNHYRGQDKILAEKYCVCRSTIKAIRLGYVRLKS